MSYDELSLFRMQIHDDLSLLTSRWIFTDPNLSKPEYAFNYWILSRVFSVDEELILDCITEYNDKGIDCFIHFEENKELHIIQNKYYSEETRVSSPEVSYFLTNPLTALSDNRYKKSSALQEIFNSIKDDPEYKVSFHFFATTDSRSDDVDQLVRKFNTQLYGHACLISASYSGISQLFELYYGKNYKPEVPFSHKLGTINRGTFASVRDVYGIEGYTAYYILAPVAQIYRMLLAAEEKKYPLFDENIREYLGDNPINNGIVNTLRSKAERNNFLHYNNGITVLCQEIGSDQQDTRSGLRMIPLEQPKIVNGCQTASSIKKVLENLPNDEMERDYKDVYVMLKALVIEDRDNAANRVFYSNVVKYTNKQNAIPEKAFTSNTDEFYRLQDEFRKRGFLLQVKPSDSNMFRNISRSDVVELSKFANKTIQRLGFSVTSLSDISMTIEKVLQVFLAFIKGGYYAFTKKNMVLQQGKEIFDDYTSQIHRFLTIDNIILLYYLYRKAENEQKQSEDKRTPIPYYVIGFLGALIGEHTESNIHDSLGIVFGDNEVCDEAYKYLVALSKNYRRSYESAGKGDYNIMIKRPIDDSIFHSAVGNASDIVDWKTINKWVKF